MGKPPFLAEELRRTLERLSSTHVLDQFYLAGGTAIGLHLEHRISRDLDFFSCSSAVDLELVKTEVQNVFSFTQLVNQTDIAIHLLCDGVTVNFVRYSYPPLQQPEVHVSGVLVANLLDLAVMKMVAISRRGLRRDFWDLYAILKTGISFYDCGRAYLQKYTVSEADLYHVAKALVYFDDAENDPIFPQGLTVQEWNRIKSFFTQEAPKFIRAL